WYAVKPVLHTDCDPFHARAAAGQCPRFDCDTFSWRTRVHQAADTAQNDLSSRRASAPENLANDDLGSTGAQAVVTSSHVSQVAEPSWPPVRCREERCEAEHHRRQGLRDRKEDLQQM